MPKERTLTQNVSLHGARRRAHCNLLERRFWTATGPIARLCGLSQLTADITGSPARHLNLGLLDKEREHMLENARS
jgi:predicted DNA-binding ribbon-helix-helix protein